MWYLANSDQSIPIAVENEINYVISFMHPGSNFTLNIITVKKYKEAFFNKHDRLPKTSVLLAMGCTEDSRVKQLLESKFTKPGFSNLFGCEQYISEHLHRMKEELENDEFCLFLPFCNRSRRVENYERVIKAL